MLKKNTQFLYTLSPEVPRMPVQNPGGVACTEGVVP